MDSQAEPTKFAPAERDSPERILAQYRTLCGHFIAQTLDAIPVIVLLLNNRRQVVLANHQTLQATRMSLEWVLGKRPGEAFGCVHAHSEPGGCGTTEFCAKCGAVRAVLMGLEGQKSVQECSMLRRGDMGVEALDLEISSSPILVDGVDYLLFCVQDLSDLKRRRTLERLFFHDMLNTTGGLRGLMDMLRQEVPEVLREDAEFIYTTLNRQVEELLSQKDLMAAENNELTPVFSALQSRELLDGAAKMGASLSQARGKAIRVLPESASAQFVSDHTLVRRVLGNMVKNALEASIAGECVTLSCHAEQGRILFRVHNPMGMTDDVRLRVFKRNFSTKGLGRGLGTYGMKLLSEHYLGGEVDFTTREGEGTTFTLSLPRDARDAGNAGDAGSADAGSGKD